jgi:hypothetical protein
MFLCLQRGNKRKGKLGDLLFHLTPEFQSLKVGIYGLYVAVFTTWVPFAVINLTVYDVPALKADGEVT